MKRILQSIIALAVMAVMVPLAAPAAENPNPYLQPDDTWISITGTAVGPTTNSFVLDYGTGTVIVEMDDWDWYGDAQGILDGDKVTVYGKIDDDLFETTSIEASSVYVENRGTYYYASASDEEYENNYDYWIMGDELAVGEMTLRGTVTDVSGREFWLDTGPRQMSVDTVSMDYNPLDEYGYPVVEEGDYVSVTGQMDYNTWDERELSADKIVVLVDD